MGYCTQTKKMELLHEFPFFSSSFGSSPGPFWLLCVSNCSTPPGLLQGARGLRGRHQAGPAPQGREVVGHGPAVHGRQVLRELSRVDEALLDFFEAQDREAVVWELHVLGVLFEANNQVDMGGVPRSAQFVSLRPIQSPKGNQNPF